MASQKKDKETEAGPSSRSFEGESKTAEDRSRDLTSSKAFPRRESHPAYDKECWDELLKEYWAEGFEDPYAAKGKPDPNKPERKHPDSWQMNFWNKYFGWLLFGNGTVGKIIQFVFVTPLTNVTGLSLYYQLYLNEIFHTRFPTRLGHFTFMPIIDFFIIAFLAQFKPWGEPYPSVYYVEPFVFNLGVAATMYFVVWYLVWGFTQNTYLFGVWMIPAMTAMALFANVYYTYFRWVDGQEHPWYDPTPWYANPLLWMLVAGMGQSGSHAFEPQLPPRVNHTAHWMPLKDFVSQNFAKNKYALVFWTIFGAFSFGIMDEIIASPRLLPLNMLKIVYMLGYKPEQWKQIQKLAKWSMEYGNPALDFIGRGGALRPPASYSEAKDRLAHLEKKLTEAEKAEALAIRDVDSSRLNEREYRKKVKYLLLRNLIAKAKLQKYAFGPFVGEGKTGEKMAKTFENRRKELAKGDAAFLAFLAEARNNIWSTEQERRAERVKRSFRKFSAPRDQVISKTW
jgi:hypothetical protein